MGGSDDNLETTIQSRRSRRLLGSRLLQHHNHEHLYRSPTPDENKGNEGFESFQGFSRFRSPTTEKHAAAAFVSRCAVEKKSNKLKMSWADLQSINRPTTKDIRVINHQPQRCCTLSMPNTVSMASKGFPVTTSSPLRGRKGSDMNYSTIIGNLKSVVSARTISDRYFPISSSSSSSSLAATCNSEAAEFFHREMPRTTINPAPMAEVLHKGKRNQYGGRTAQHSEHEHAIKAFNVNALDAAPSIESTNTTQSSVSPREPKTGTMKTSKQPTYGPSEERKFTNTENDVDPFHKVINPSRNVSQRSLSPDSADIIAEVERAYQLSPIPRYYKNGKTFREKSEAASTSFSLSNDDCKERRGRNQKRHQRGRRTKPQVIKKSMEAFQLLEIENRKEKHYRQKHRRENLVEPGNNLSLSPCFNFAKAGILGLQEN